MEADILAIELTGFHLNRRGRDEEGNYLYAYQVDSEPLTMSAEGLVPVAPKVQALLVEHFDFNPKLIGEISLPPTELGGSPTITTVVAAVQQKLIEEYPAYAPFIGTRVQVTLTKIPPVEES